MSVIPALWEVRWVDDMRLGVQDQWPTWQNPVSTKNTKISWVWFCTSVFSASQEAEAEESLEPGRQRLSELRSRYYTAAWVIKGICVHKMETEVLLCSPGGS